MSKRKERSGQRLNRELLDRAREQAQGMEAEIAEEEKSSSAPVKVSAQPRTSSTRSTAARLRARNHETRKSKMSGDDVAYLLANPTKVVTEEELHAQYGFVLADLGSMGILAAASFAILLVLAFILPK